MYLCIDLTNMNKPEKTEQSKTIRSIKTDLIDTDQQKYLSYSKMIDVNWGGSGLEDIQFKGSVNQICSKQTDLGKLFSRCIEIIFKTYMIVTSLLDINFYKLCKQHVGRS